MALVDNAWYIDDGDNSTTGWWAKTKWSNHTAVAGELIRQFTTPAVGSERMFICVTAGATGSTEPTWVVTRGALNTSSSAVYQECTGIAALNGDATNTPTWTTVKNTAVTLGQVIQRNNGASYQICTVAGTAGNGAEPAFSDTAGTATTDNTVTWKSCGVVGNFTPFGCPHARLASAFASTWGQAGNSFYLANTHAETQTTAMLLNSPGTYASPCFVYVVDKNNAPPTSSNLSTGASISTTTTGTIGIGTTGSQQCYYTSSGANGLIFNCGSGANAVAFSVATSGSGAALTFRNCALRLGGTSGGALAFGSAASVTPTKVVLDNTTVQFASTASLIRQSGLDFQWLNTPSAITGATFPTTLFTSSNAAPGLTTIRAVDLSALAAGKTIFGAITAAIRTNLIDCKLNASATLAATPTSPGDAELYVIRSDSANTNYRQEKYSYMGTQTVETTIVRTGGATDGTTALAWKVVTTANSKWVLPFECIPITIWNDTITPTTFTVTIFGIWGGGAVPNNDDIWIDVEGLGTASFPLGTVTTTTKANNLATGSATTSDASTWGGSTTAFKMVTSAITMQSKGDLNIFVKCAKASTTFYIDPKAVLT